MRRLLLIFILSFFALLSGAQVITAHRGEVQNGYNFWLYVPECYDSLYVGETPVIIFLHGSSLCGNDLHKVLRYGVIDAVRRGHVIDALVVAPQNPGGAPWNPDRVLNVLDWVMEKYKPDANRVYVLGMSLGGYGTLDFVGAHPERVAAALAMCGGTTLKSVEGMTRVPLWIMHGTADTVVRVSESKKVVSAMEQYGCTDLLRYDWIEGCDHGKLARMFYQEKIYEWLFSHSMTDWPRQISRELEFCEDLFNNVYSSGDPARAAAVKLVE